jgi:hypothetical protein
MYSVLLLSGSHSLLLLRFDGACGKGSTSMQKSRAAHMPRCCLVFSFQFGWPVCDTSTLLYDHVSDGACWNRRGLCSWTVEMSGLV